VHFDDCLAEDGDHKYKRPTEAELSSMLDQMDGGSIEFVIVSRTTDPSGATFIQTARNADGTYVVEHKSATQDGQLRAIAEQLKDVKDTILGWAGNKPGWDYLLSWSLPEEYARWVSTDTTTRPSESQSTSVFHALTQIYLGKDFKTGDIPGIRVRRGPFSLIGGFRTGGRLDVETGGVRFRSRRWPFSQGVWGRFFIPWNDISQVEVKDPIDKRGASLGGSFWIVMPNYPSRLLLCEFMGSQEKMKAALKAIEAPLQPSEAD